MKYVLIILILNGSSADRKEIHDIASLADCRTQAHQITGDTRRLESITHQFVSPSGLTTAYCVTQR